MEAVSTPCGHDDAEHMSFARAVLDAECAGVRRTAEALDERFCLAVRMLCACRGSVIVTGMGKAGHIGQKISATLASTGTPSHFLHPAEAVHGDLGRLRSEDVVVVLSKSGETDEVLQLLANLTKRRLPIIALTSCPGSSLGRAATVVLVMPDVSEACSLGLAPSTSTTAMLALGDALALTVSRARGFRREEFNCFHPGGNLGRQNSSVDEHMRPLSECRLADEAQTVRQVFVSLGRPGRRSGAIMLVDVTGRLSGIFTDSDLARLLESQRDVALDRPMFEVMTRSPRRLFSGALLGDALAMLAAYRISELPVVDSEHRPVGLIDVTDLVQLIPDESPAEVPPPANSTLPGNRRVTATKLAVFPEPTNC